jgi:hypothetical protein
MRRDNAWLGAQQSGVVRLVVGRKFLLGGCGAALGMALGVAVMRIAERLVFCFGTRKPASSSADSDPDPSSRGWWAAIGILGAGGMGEISGGDGYMTEADGTQT